MTPDDCFEDFFQARHFEVAKNTFRLGFPFFFLLNSLNNACLRFIEAFTCLIQNYHTHTLSKTRAVACATKQRRQVTRDVISMSVL